MMELVRGIARNVHALATTSTQQPSGGVGLEVNGRTVRLDMPAQECPWPIRDGDDIIVAGDMQAGTLVGFAYKDVTQAYVSSLSYGGDAVQAWLTLILGLGVFWFGWNAHSEVSVLLWGQRLVVLSLALLFASFTLVYLNLIVEKRRATFLVVSASFETVKGIARNVEHVTGEREAPGRAVRIGLDGRRVHLAMSREINIRDGDEIVVTGEQAGDVLVGIAYRNVTRSVLGRAWSSASGMIFVPLCVMLIIAVFAGLWWNGNGDDVDIWTAIRRLLALGFLVGTMLLALDRFFRWKLHWEACRRVKLA
jgi:hypothetical protein